MQQLVELEQIFKEHSIEEALALTASFFPGKIKFSTSLGQEDQVLTDIIARNNIPINIFTLDTGRLFNEMYETLEKTNARYRINIDVFFPQHQSVQKMVSDHGVNLFYESVDLRKACCGVRKVEPLNRALEGASVWITGLRAAQTEMRKNIPVVEWLDDKKIYKINPLLHWSYDEVLDYINKHSVPYNSLHDKRFHQHWLRTLHPCHRAGRGSAGWQVVVGAIAKRMWTAFGKIKNNMNKESIFPRALEHEAIYIMREVAAQFEKPAILFSGGKDSITLVHLARKAFYPAKVPFPMLHIDTGHNFPETISFRDWLAEHTGMQLIVRYVQDSIDQGKVKEETGKYASRNVLQTTTLLDAIEELKFDACIGGARRDEEKARAKERVFSVRDDFGQWDAKKQRPELFHMLNGKINLGEHVRVFPISNWTELDVWNYIREEKLDLPSIYFSHKRQIIERDGLYWPYSEYLNTGAEEIPFEATVRFRTVGDMTCTAAVLSEAATLDTIIGEIKEATISERGARIDDKRSEAAMEKRKKEGYF